MTVKICASVTARTLKEVKQMAKKAERDGADLLEIRVDYAREQYSLDEIRKLSGLPMIATNRASCEGGMFKGSEEERISQLFAAADADFDFADVELSTKGSKEILRKLTNTGTSTIVSIHIFDTADLPTLKSVFKKELRCHTDVCKIVALAQEFKDNLECLRFLGEASKKTDVACFCTGELGLTSRLISPLFGGCFTYAAVERGKEAAKGQLTVSEMRSFYEVLGV